MRLKFSILLVLGWGIVACSPTANQRFPHEGPVDWSPLSDEPQQSEGKAAHSSEFESLDLSGFEKKLESNEGSFEILKKLGIFVLNPNYLKTPGAQTQKLKRSLKLVNRALLNLMKGSLKAPLQKELKRHIGSYLRVAFGRNSHGSFLSPQFRSFLKSDVGTTDVLIEISVMNDVTIEREIKKFENIESCLKKSSFCRKSIERRYSILSLASDLRGGLDRNDRFNFLYIKYSRVLASLIRLAEESSKSDSELFGMRKRLKRLGAVQVPIFNIIIEQTDSLRVDAKEMRSFVDNFNPWTYSNRKNDIFQKGSRVIFEMAADCCIYEDEKKNVLSSSFRKSILMRSELEDAAQPSILSIIQRLEKTRGQKMFRALKVEGQISRFKKRDPELLDEVYFIIDSLFRDHLDYDQSWGLLQKLKKSRVSKKLPGHIDIYVKIQMLGLMQESVDSLKKFYLEGNYTAKSFFSDLKSSTQQMTNRWLVFLEKVSQLEKFMRAYSERVYLDNEGKSEFLSQRRQLQGMNHYVHNLAIYPEMILINFLMLKMRGSIDGQIYSFKFEEPGEKILEKLFAGHYGPWLGYSGDPIYFKKGMLFYVFSNGLKTGSFESLFQKDASLKEKAEFFDKILTRSVEEEIRQASVELRKLKRSKQNLENYRTALDFCEFDTGSKNGLTRDLPLKQIEYYTYFGSGTVGLSSSIWDVMQKRQSLAKTFGSRGANSLDSRIDQLFAFSRIIERYLLKQGVKVEELNTHPYLEKFRKMLSDYDQMKVALLTEIDEKFEKEHECLLKFKRVEIARQNRLIFEEANYLGRVHDQLTKIRQKDANQIREASISYAKRFFSNEFEREVQASQRPAMTAGNLEKSEKGVNPRFLENFESGDYITSRFDLYMRMLRRIEGDIFTTLSDEENGAYPFHEAEVKRARRVRGIIPDDVAGLPFVQDSSLIRIHYRSDRSEFISMGLRSLFGGTNPYLRWILQRRRSVHSHRFLEALVEFYLISNRDPEECNFTFCRPRKALKAEMLTRAYALNMAHETMSPADLRVSKLLGSDGNRFPSFFDTRFVDPTDGGFLPLFDKLVDLAVKNVNTDHSSATRGSLGEAREIAEQETNDHRFLFEQEKHLNRDWVDVYGVMARGSLSYISDLLFAVNKFEKDFTEGHSEKNGDRLSILEMKQLLSRPYLRVGTSNYSWSADSGFLYSQEFRDQKTLVLEFTRMTNNIFRTSQIKSPKPGEVREDD